MSNLATTHTRMKRRGDDGYSVLVVMGFVLLLVSAILYTGFQIQNDTINGQSLAATSARHDAITAVSLAGVQSIRYDPLIGSGQTLPGPSYCFGGGPASTTSVNTFTATAYCSTTMTTTITGYACTAPAVLSGTNCNTTTTSATGSTTTTTTPATPTGTSTRHVTLIACASGDVTSCVSNPELTVTTTLTDDQVDTATNTTNCAAVCGQVETIGEWKW